MSEQGLAIEEFAKIWNMGLESDRRLGRPEGWNGEPSGFDDFAFKDVNWLAALQGDAE